MSKNTIVSIILVVAVLAVGYYVFANSNKPMEMPEDLLYSQDQTSGQNNSSQENPMNQQENTQPASETAPEQAIIRFETTEGSFKVALDGKAAPKTVNNFIKLANEGFYDGLTFHRIVEGFMIQGGDPQGDGTGGPGYTVPAEIGLKHTKGAIAMARTGDQVNPERASSGSQFYVTLEATPFLDGQYTVFGYVSEGMNVVEKIGKTPTEPNPLSGEQSVPLKEVKISKVVVEETN